MKKKFLNAGVAVGLFLGTALITYALTTYFTKEEIFLRPKPKPIFEIKIDAGEQPGEIGPGDSFPTSPTVYNDATENMYVFITVSDGGLYEFVVGDGWVEVEDGVYAYAGDEMTTLAPGERTDPLTTQFTMKEISRADFAQLTDISVKITGYAIGTEGVETEPSAAWSQCKMIGQIG